MIKSEPLALDIETFNLLSEVPLSVNNKSEALERICELGRRALNSDACTLAEADLQTKHLTTLACTGFDKRFKDYMVGRKIKMSPYREGSFIDYKLLAKGEGGERYGLQVDGQGLANPKIARKYGLNALLSYPLKSEDGLILYFNHFSSKPERFSEEEKTLIKIFGRMAKITIERFDYLQAEERSLRILKELSQSLISLSPSDFILQVPAKAAELLEAPICIVWELDKHQRKLSIVATHGNVDDEYKNIEISLDDPGIKKHLSSRAVGYLSDVTQPHLMYKHSEEAARRGWVSLLSAPMWGKDDLTGMLNIYTDRPRSFKNWEKELFYTFANHVALSLQKAESLIADTSLAKIRKLRDHDQIVGEIREAVDRVTSSGGDEAQDEIARISNIIVRKCAIATGATTGFLWLWDKVTNQLTRGAYYSVFQEDDAHKARKEQVGKLIAEQVAITRKPAASKNASSEKPLAKVCTASEICSYLCVPIKSGDIVIGTIGVCSDKIALFESDEESLLERIANEMSISIERAHLADGLLRLAEATIQSNSLEDLLNKLVELTRELMREPICVVCLLDKDKNGFAAKAIAPPEGQKVNPDSLFIPNSAVGIDRFFAKKEPLYFQDASLKKYHPYAKELERLGWKSMLSMPLTFKDHQKERRIGILEVYSFEKERGFTDWHRKLFKTLAVQASIALVSWRRRKRIEGLFEVMQDMESEQNVDKLFKMVLKQSLKLAGSSRGWISRLHLSTGLMQMVVQKGEPPQTEQEWKVGEGITGKALEQEEPLLADDVRSEKWQGIYRECWPDTRSELAVPILIAQAKVRVGHKSNLASRPIGVINIESPTINAFSEVNKNTISALARHVAVIIDRLELNQKLTKLAEVQKKLSGKRDWDDILEVVPDAITAILGYDYVNISLVFPDEKRIKTVYIAGIPPEKVQKFKNLADHLITSNDIQADIVRTKRIEVPDVNDERFDKDVYDEFGHGNVIRVFMPIIVPPRDQVIGSVEAGYRRGYRKFIYEQDVQILKNFIDYAVLSLEPRIRRLIEIISHDFSGALVGVRNNVSRLQRGLGNFTADYIGMKLEDLMLDIEVLQNQIDSLQHTFGRIAAISKKEKTVVFRDVVIKTIQDQLRPIARVHLQHLKKFDTLKVEYNNADIHKIVLYVDKARLNQVVNNVLSNSIKYAEHDPAKFRIKITVSETADYFIITFRDWGIGIAKGLEEQIFEESFRAPEAIRKTVKGAGLGLSIARKIMRDMGGDLKLTRNSKPTVFQMLLPKSLKEDLDDLDR